MCQRDPIKTGFQVQLYQLPCQGMAGGISDTAKSTDGRNTTIVALHQELVGALLFNVNVAFCSERGGLIRLFFVDRHRAQGNCRITLHDIKFIIICD